MPFYTFFINVFIFLQCTFSVIIFAFAFISGLVLIMNGEKIILAVNADDLKPTSTLAL